MLKIEEANEQLLLTFPDYKVCLEEYSEYFDPRVGIIIGFNSFISDKLKKNEHYEYNKVFDLAEEFLKKGDDYLQNVICTMFLEDFINYSEYGDFPASSFIPYLGPESKAYLKALDELNGIKTPGLWDNE